MQFKQAYPYPFIGSKSTVALAAKAISLVLSVELLSTTIISWTIEGMSLITFPMASASLWAGMMTLITVSRIYLFVCISSCCAGTIKLSKYHEDHSSKLKKSTVAKTAKLTDKSNRFFLFRAGLISHKFSFFLNLTVP